MKIAKKTNKRKKELLKLTSICKQHNIIIRSDEIHCQLLLDEDKNHVPTATLSHEIAERTITLMSPSKTFNIPGLGFSFAVIPNTDLRRRFLQQMAGIVPHINTLGYTAALAAYENGSAWHSDLIKYLQKNRDTLENEINNIKGLSMEHVEATYLAFIDTNGAKINDPVNFFESAGIGLSDGRYFGCPGFVRLNFGCSHSTLIQAIQKIKNAMTTL